MTLEETLKAAVTAHQLRAMDLDEFILALETGCAVAQDILAVVCEIKRVEDKLCDVISLGLFNPDDLWVAAGRQAEVYYYG